MNKKNKADERLNVCKPPKYVKKASKFCVTSIIKGQQTTSWFDTEEEASGFYASLNK